MENTYQTYYNQIAKTTGILFKARRFLPSQTIRTLYYSLFYPYLNYGNMGKYLSLEIGINQYYNYKTTKEDCQGYFIFRS